MRLRLPMRLHMRLRAGFTLVELLVAVLLIDVGLLALVAGSAVVVRRQGDVRTRTVASRAAANRIQLLAASACAAASGTSNVSPGIVERWAVELEPNGVRELRDSVTFVLSGTEHVVVLRTRVPC